MIEIKNLSIQRGKKTLLKQANAMIPTHKKVGLIGQNGTGKSTLFAMIRGEIASDEGDILIPQRWKIASVSQETPASEKTALDYTLLGDDELCQLRQELTSAEVLNDGHKIALIHERLDDIDAYTAPHRAAKLLFGLGFSEAEHHKATKEFSGGWRMRLNLAQALMCRSDLLLLDEPTNHLDLETVIWLEQYLKSLTTTQIIISHDRDFLNNITTQTLELAQERLNSYGGNYDFYLKERALRLQQQEAQYSKQQTHIKHLQSFIDRFKAKATKATQAQSRMKALAKLERIAPAHLDTPFEFSFPKPDYLPNTLLSLDHVSLGYHDSPILSNLSLSIENGARYGLLGLNGSGKSTLIKTIAGTLAPLSGECIYAQKCKIGYFAQHQLDVLNDQASPIQHIQTLSLDVKEQVIRDFLGGFAFQNEMATSPIAHFSGGEKARLALAMLVWQKPNLLLLDEPTNHLDLDMRHALTMALQHFEGAMILVSHDRTLIDTTCNSLWVINQGILQTFDGTLSDYQKWRLEQYTTQKPVVSNNTVNRKETKKQEARLRQEINAKTKSYKDQTQKSEKIIDKLNLEKDDLETFLSSEEAYNDDDKELLKQKLYRLAELKSQLEDEEMSWLSAQEKIEEIEKHYHNIQGQTQ